MMYGLHAGLYLVWHVHLVVETAVLLDPLAALHGITCLLCVPNAMTANTFVHQDDA